MAGRADFLAGWESTDDVPSDLVEAWRAVNIVHGDVANIFQQVGR